MHFRFLICAIEVSVRVVSWIVLFRPTKDTVHELRRIEQHKSKIENWQGIYAKAS
jgi:hypothetical protein